MRKLTLNKILPALVIISVLMLGVYNTKDRFFGASFSIKTVLDGASVKESFLPISGIALHASSLEINGRHIAMDTNGTFSDGVVLSPGYNIIEITQKDRFGKEKTKVVHVVAQPSQAVATTMQIHYQ